MNYVDGFVLPVPKAKLDAYRELAEKAAAILRELGALEVRECVADDVKAGVLTSFPQSVLLKDDEVVVFSWIVFESREARDKINAAFMADPRMAGMMDPRTHPFDSKRMFFGGFKVLVAA